MEDAVLVREVDGARYFTSNAHGFIDCHLAVAEDPRLERFPVDEWHDAVQLLIHFARIEDRQDVRVLEFRRELDLAAESRREQAGAGLDTLTAKEFAQFTALNDAYRKKFGFPFILAVKGADKQLILKTFTQRIEHDPEAELATAIAQVGRIINFRIEDRVQA